MRKTTFYPIGVISSDFLRPKETFGCCEKGLRSRNVAKIILKPKYAAGLEGLENFSHAFILYFLHKIKKFEIKTYPGPISIKNLPDKGIFATRSQLRPNPIALRLVKIIKIEG